MKSFLVFLFLTQPILAMEFSELVPEAGNVKTTIYQLVPSKKFMEFTERLQAAVKKHPDLIDLNRLKSGGPLPYDKRMDLSKKEYEEYIEFSKKGTEFKLEKAIEIDIKVSKGSNYVSFSSPVALPGLGEIKLYPQTRDIETPRGKLTKPKFFDSSHREGLLLGGLTGYEWKIESGSIESGNFTVMSLIIGKRIKSKDRLLYYKLQGIVEGVTHKTIRQFISY